MAGRELTLRGAKIIRTGLQRHERRSGAPPRLAAASLCQTVSSPQPISALPSFRDAIEKLLAAQIEFATHKRGRCTERIFQFVHGQRGVSLVVAQDDSHAVAAANVDAPRRADR